MTNPTPLSPAAQAVMDAFGNTSNGEYIEGVWIVNEQAMLAAALRAAAVYSYCPMDRQRLAAIATELEGNP